MAVGFSARAHCGDDPNKQPQTIEFSSSTNSPIEGGKSPDGKYEVRVFKTSQREPSDYFYGLVESSSGRVIKQIDDGASYCTYEAMVNFPENAHISWNKTSDLFALTDHGGRHSMDLYLYEVGPTSVKKIDTPDYLKRGLSVVGLKKCYLVSVAKGIEWNGDVLKCSLAFDGDLPNGEGRSDLYTTDFYIEITKKGRAYPKAVIMKMDDPHGNPG